jgi:hypothetical protein
MAQKEESGEDRPSVAAYFVELDEHATPFLTALGQVVVAVAALEGNLRLELARLRISNDASATQSRVATGWFTISSKIRNSSRRP